MAIDDKERIHFRGRGPRGERKARKLNALVEMIQRATPADAGHKNVRIRKTERGAVFTGTPGGVGGGAQRFIRVEQPEAPGLRSQFREKIVEAYEEIESTPRPGDILYDFGTFSRKYLVTRTDNAQGEEFELGIPYQFSFIVDDVEWFALEINRGRAKVYEIVIDDPPANLSAIGALIEEKYIGGGTEEEPEFWPVAGDVITFRNINSTGSGMLEYLGSMMVFRTSDISAPFAPSAVIDIGTGGNQTTTLRAIFIDKSRRVERSLANINIDTDPDYSSTHDQEFYFVVELQASNGGSVELLLQEQGPITRGEAYLKNDNDDTVTTRHTIKVFYPKGQTPTSFSFNATIVGSASWSLIGQRRWTYPHKLDNAL